MEINKKVFWNILWVAIACILIYTVVGERERYDLFTDKISAILSPFLFGSVLAFVLNVPMRGFERLLKRVPKANMRRGLAAMLTFLMVLLIMAVVFLLLIPQLSETLENMIPALVSFATDIGERINQFLADNPELMKWVEENTDFETINWAEIVEKAFAVLGNSISAILLKAISTISTLVTMVMDLIIGVIFAVYCLFQKETLARQGRKLLYAYLPEKTSDYIVRVMRLTNSTFSNFLSGQCIEVVILGVMFAIAMSVFNMPYIPLICVIVSVTAFIPVVGAWVGCILGAFFIFVADPVLALWFVVMSIVLQQIENNLIYPKVVGESVGLSGMWVLVAVGLGGQLMGVAGMFLMIPIVSVFYTLLQEHTNKKLQMKDINAEKLNVSPPELSSKLKEKIKSQTDKMGKKTNKDDTDSKKDK